MGRLFGLFRTKKNTNSQRQKRKQNKSRKNNLFTLSQSSSYVSEQFRIIRAILLRSAKEKNVRTILVTSALPQEGKTFVSSNLAVSLAQEVDKVVVLIDTDLRNPSINTMFGLSEEQVGLSTFFSNGIKLPDVLCKTELPNLLIFPAGPCTEKSEEILSAQRMGYLINKINSIYKDCYIIIDSGPVQIVADSLVLAELVDGIVLVIKARETRKDVVHKTAEMLGKEKIMGVVLNYCVVPSKVYQRYYNYYGKKT